GAVEGTAAVDNAPSPERHAAGGEDGGQRGDRRVGDGQHGDVGGHRGGDRAGNRGRLHGGRQAMSRGGGAAGDRGDAVAGGRGGAAGLLEPGRGRGLLRRAVDLGDDAVHLGRIHGLHLDQPVGQGPEGGLA